MDRILAAFNRFSSRTHAYCHTVLGEADRLENSSSSCPARTNHHRHFDCQFGGFISSYVLVAVASSLSLSRLLCFCHQIAILNIKSQLNLNLKVFAYQFCHKTLPFLINPKPGKKQLKKKKKPVVDSVCECVCPELFRWFVCVCVFRSSKFQIVNLIWCAVRKGRVLLQ